MDIVVFSDLHMNSHSSDEMDVIRSIVRKESPDVALVCGDVFESSVRNPYEMLSELGVPVAFCLGNHEFVGRTVEETMGFYGDLQRRWSGHDIFCLDVVGHVDFGDLRIAGNVLWYDGSMSDRDDVKSHMAMIDRGWIDSMIVGFNPEMEFRKCAAAISESLSGWCGQSILVTHMAPHRKANVFSRESPDSIYNIYSGVDNLFTLLGIHPSLSLCGHTHRKCKCLAVSHDIDGSEHVVPCVNIGNDYFLSHDDVEYEVVHVDLNGMELIDGKGTCGLPEYPGICRILPKPGHQIRHEGSEAE